MPLQIDFISEKLITTLESSYRDYGKAKQEQAYGEFIYLNIDRENQREQ